MPPVVSDPLANSTNPWAPAEDKSTLLAEHAWLQGVILSSVAYGAELVLFCMCVYLLIKQMRRQNLYNSIITIAFVCVVFILGTLFMGSLAEFTQLAFIDNRNFPGGPNAYENVMFAIPVDSMGNVSAALQNWLCDALLVWRLIVIFQGCGYPLWIIMFPPCLLYLTSFAFGILWLIQVSDKGPFSPTAIDWTIPYFATSLSLNIIISLAIALRLLFFRRRVASILGPSHGSQYTSIAAMIVESAFIFSAIYTTFIVFLALKSPLDPIFFQPLNQVQTCATLLIIFRIASGKGWNAHAQSTLSGQFTRSSSKPRRAIASYELRKITSSHSSVPSAHSDRSSLTLTAIKMPGEGRQETMDSTRAVRDIGEAEDD